MALKKDLDGCFHKAEDDEPLFTLLARDRQAPATVEYWATLRYGIEGKSEKIRSAEQTADAMREWYRHKEVCGYIVDGKYTPKLPVIYRIVRQDGFKHFATMEFDHVLSIAELQELHVMLNKMYGSGSYKIERTR